MANSQNVEIVRQMLIDYRLLSEDYWCEIERIERLDDRLLSLGGSTVSDMPRAPSPTYDKKDELITLKMEAEGRLEAMKPKMDAERGRIESMVCLLRKPKEKSLIRYYYFDCEGWDCVLVQLFGDEPDFLGKEESYKRRMRRIHYDAIFDMAQLYEACMLPKGVDSNGN